MSGLVAALVLLAIAGASLWASLLAARQMRIARERRISLLSRARPSEALRGPNWRFRLGAFDARARRVFAFRMPAQWGMTSGAVRLVASGAAAGGLAAFVFGRWLGMSSAAALPAAALCFMVVPRLMLRREQLMAERQFMTLFPDTVDMIVRMLRAGLPITAAIQTVGAEAQYPIDVLFRSLTDQIAIGMDFDTALTVASGRIGVPDFSFFAAAVALQRTTGGNLAVTLESLAQIIRRRRAARLKAHAATAEVRLSALVLGAMPFIVTGLLLILNPAYLAPLVIDPRGRIMVAAALCLLLLGFAAMRRLMRSTEAL